MRTVLIGLRVWLMAIFAMIAFMVNISQVRAVNDLPEGFSVDVVASGFTLPTTVDFAPDGRIFVAEKSGTVKVIKDGNVLVTPFIRLSDVNDANDRGLIGMALDPDFSQNGYVYLGYTYENDASNYGGEKTARIVRVTADGDTAAAGSERVILGTIGGTPAQPSCKNFPKGSDCIASDSLSHTIGGLRFGKDGKLYVATGDGAGFTGLDEQAFRSLDITDLSGKILRINTDGSGVSDNPFFTGNADDVQSKVWSYGLRNPYRFTVHPEDGRLIGGEVGWFTREEVNHLQAGKNYGWPCREGADQSVGGYTTFSQCDNFAGYTDPIHDYLHQGGSGAITGGAFAISDSYPSYFRGSYLYADFSLDFMKYLDINSNSEVEGVADFATDVAGPVEIVTGPEGLIYYLSIYTGELRKLTYNEVRSGDPVAVIGVSTTNKAPYVGTFDARDSFDPEGEELSYSWDFGDGTSGTGINPAHTYGAEGTYIVTLTVNTPRGVSAVETVTVTFEESSLDNDSEPFPIAVSASPSGPKYLGTPLELNATIGNLADNDPFIVLLQIYDSNDQTVEQVFYTDQKIATGSEKTYDFSWLPEGLGEYYVSVGLFKNDWSDPVHPWSHNVFSFEVVDRAPTGPTCGNATIEAPEQCDDGNSTDGDGCSAICTIEESDSDANIMPLDVSIEPKNIAVGDTVTVTSKMINTGGPGTVLVDIEIYDTDHEMVGQKFFDNQTFAAGETKEYIYTWKMPADEIYEVEIGVFDPGWSTLREWFSVVEIIFTDVSEDPVQDPADEPEEDPASVRSVLFDDAITTNWENWSWNTNGPKFESATGPDQQISQVINLSYTDGWGGLYFHKKSPLSIEQSDTLQFWIKNENGQVAQGITVSLYDTDNKRAKRIDLSAYATSTTQWQKVDIPMSALISESSEISGIVIQDGSGSAGEKYYIDQIKIVK